MTMMPTKDQEIESLRQELQRVNELVEVLLPVAGSLETSISAAKLELEHGMVQAYARANESFRFGSEGVESLYPFMLKCSQAQSSMLGFAKHNESRESLIDKLEMLEKACRDTRLGLSNPSEDPE